MNKKLFFMISVILLLLVGSSSCQSNSHTLATAGTEVIALMAEMSESEDYAALYNLPAAYDETVAKLTGDYRKPSAVYELDVPESELLGFAADDIRASDALSNYLHAAACISVASRINQNSGIEALAVSSAYAAQMTFLCPNEGDNVTNLYIFENGAPMIIFFLPGEDGSVRAIGYFLLNDALNTESSEKIETSLSEIGIPNVKVYKK